jgi:hypothetical protein
MEEEKMEEKKANSLTINPAEEINELYSEVIDGVRTTLSKAIAIGELLIAQKEKIERGEWILWIENNLRFDAVTANRYMRLYRHKDQLANKSPGTYSGIKSALKLLSQPREKTAPGSTPPINTVAFEMGKKLGNIYHKLTEMWEYKDQINKSHVFVIEESIQRMHDLIKE